MLLYCKWYGMVNCTEWYMVLYGKCHDMVYGYMVRYMLWYILLYCKGYGMVYCTVWYMLRFSIVTVYGFVSVTVL